MLGCIHLVQDKHGSSWALIQRQIAPIQVTVHHLASDDYVRQEATFWLTNLRPDVQVYVEHSNEVWNPLFPQGRYATEQAPVHEQSS